MPLIALYIGSIALANVLTAHLAPWLLPVDGHVVAITAGTWVIACTFWLRDLVQRQFGLRRTWAAIAVALAVNLLASVHYTDLAWITAASGAAFLVSEGIDTWVYTVADGRLGRRILLSGLFSCPADSIIFVLLGLSPLTTGIIGWNTVMATIVAQAAIKLGLQLAAALPLWRLEPAWSS